MTILFADGFDDWAYANRTEEGWTQTLSGAASAIDITSGRRAGSSAVRLSVDNGTGRAAALNRGLGSSVSTIFLHGAVNFTRGAGTRGVLQFRESTTAHITITLKSDGNVEARRGQTAGTLLGTSTTPIANTTWVSLEAKVVVHDTTGSVDVLINGSSILALSGIDTRNGGASGVVNDIVLGDPVNLSSTSMTALYDDLVVYDTTGSILTTFAGDLRVDCLRPTAAGDSTQFTPSAGANYECVDDATANGVTDYVESSTAGHIDLFATADMAHTPTAIYGAYATINAQKDDAGARSIKLKCKSGGTTGTGSTQALTAGSYVRIRELFETDPNTSAAWTKTNLNAAQFGFENV